MSSEETKISVFPEASKNRGPLRRLLWPIRRLCSSFTRSWILGCLNYRLASTCIIIASFVLLLAYIYKGKIDLLSTIPIVFFSVVAGIYMAAHDFAFFIRRAKALMDEGESGQQVISDSRQGTGLSQLDDLVNSYITSTANLQDTIEALGEETDMLIERYQVLTENLAAAIVIRDNEGKIAYCSPYTEVLTGYSLSEIYDSEEDFFNTIVHEEDREEYKRALKVSTFGEAFKFRYRFLHKTGIEMWAETRTVPIIDDEGGVSSSLSITLDVTGTIRYQTQVEEKNRDLEDFSYMISHDLKSPIFTIKGMVNVIKEDYQDSLSPEFQDIISHIRKGVSRLEQLVTSVLEYSKISTGESLNESVALSEVLKDVQNDYSTQLRDAKTQVRIEGELPIVIGERTKVYQIFSNLVGNAIKYRSAERPLEINVSVESSKSEHHVGISVQDNGSGIPADKLDSIFRPFYRAHSRDIEGSGIGLACVKKLLEKLDGEIDVQSEEGMGSEFLVTLRTAGEQP